MCPIQIGCSLNHGGPYEFVNGQSHLLGVVARQHVTEVARRHHKVQLHTIPHTTHTEHSGKLKLIKSLEW